MTDLANPQTDPLEIFNVFICYIRRVKWNTNSRLASKYPIYFSTNLLNIWLESQKYQISCKDMILLWIEAELIQLSLDPQFPFYYLK